MISCTPKKTENKHSQREGGMRSNLARQQANLCGVCDLAAEFSCGTQYQCQWVTLATHSFGILSTFVVIVGQRAFHKCKDWKKESKGFASSRWSNDNDITDGARPIVVSNTGSFGS